MAGPIRGDGVEDPKKLVDFIERNNLGYLLGRAVTAIIKANESLTKEERLAHLKDARNLLTILIKRGVK